MAPFFLALYLATLALFEHSREQYFLYVDVVFIKNNSPQYSHSL